MCRGSSTVQIYMEGISSPSGNRGYSVVCSSSLFIYRNTFFALDVGKMVQIEGGEKSQGAFYMTTVSMKEGNIFWYLYSGISPYMKRIPKGEVHREDESSEEYFQRQMEVMQASQDDSIIAAYRQAGKKVDVKNNGVIVLERMDQMPHRRNWFWVILSKQWMVKRCLHQKSY